ncbi:MAG: hypothetical protein LCH46_07245 [Proteobacteria bacterium]|nr:hypothetical protein [Pseudomonadota bacterium]
MAIVNRTKAPTIAVAILTGLATGRALAMAILSMVSGSSGIGVTIALDGQRRKRANKCR